jgi:hypothetical protein
VLEPDPELVAVAIVHKKGRQRRRPIPSVCEICNEPFDSKLKLDDHLRVVHPIEPPFNDSKRAEFLKFLVTGTRFFAACKAVKISPSTVKRAMRVDPAFLEAVELAEEEAAEKAEVWLWEQAEAGNMSAITKILDKRQAKRWADANKTLEIKVSGSVEHKADGELMAHQVRVLELQARAQERIALKGGSELPILDVEEIQND